MKEKKKMTCLVGGFNPSEKNSQNLPQIGVKNKKCLKPPPSL